MSARQKLLPATQDIDGQPVCLLYNPTLYRGIQYLEPQDGDIIEVSYPRSGTHWVQQIVQLILSNGESANTFIEFTERAPLLEVQELNTTQFPRLLRTHYPMNKLRLSEKAKYIYVARNPWDCCVSCYHVIRDRPLAKYANGTFDDFLDGFLDGQIGFGDYFDHLISGYSHRNDPNVFFVTYEELHRNRKEVVLRLADFLGEHHRRALQENEDVLQRVLEKSTATFMRALLKTNQLEGMKIFMKNSPGLRLAQYLWNQLTGETKDIHVLRKAVVGNWKEHFTPNNIEKMQAAIEKRTEGSDIMDIWKVD